MNLNPQEQNVYNFLKMMADFPLSVNWTEHHWKYANCALVDFELNKGIRTWEEVFNES